MESTFDFVTDPLDICKALEESEDCQTIIGISSRELGRGIFMTFVKEITNEGEEKIVVLNNYDITGHFLEKNKVSIKAISSVIPFRAVFTNPFLKQLQQTQKSDRAEMQQPDYII